ncbi:MAG: oligosaccharide flippase family protein [Methanosarcinaceae archaeon]|nr:oligosaccharide flippase family protein [Methanosarcinaceae archaeon]
MGMEIISESRKDNLKGNALVGRTAFTLTTYIITALLGTLTGFLAARILGPEGRGELAAMQSWALVFGAIAGLGMSEAVVYFGSRNPTLTTSYLATAIIPVAISVCLSAGMGWWLMPLLLHAQTQQVITGARILLLMMMPIFGMFVVYESLRAYGAWRSWNYLRILPPLFWLCVLLVAIFKTSWANPSFLAKIYPAIFLCQIVPALFIVWRHHARFPIKPNLQYIKPLISYGAPVMATALPQTLNLRLDQLMMASILPAQSLGLYVAAVSWSTSSSIIFLALSQVFFPHISSVANRDHQKRFIKRSILLSSLLAISLTGLILLVTPAMVILFFGEKYRPAIPVALILAIACTFLNINQILSSVLKGLGHPRGVMFSEVFGLIITVVLLFLLLPKYQILGAGIASLVAYGGVTLVSLFYVRKAMARPLMIDVGPLGSDLVVKD